MYHNKKSFGGVLQPLVESLERSPRQKGRLVGQDIVVYGRKDIEAVIAIDSDNNIHLLIKPSAADYSDLSKLDLTGLRITDVDWSISGKQVQRYMDISCSTGIKPSFRRPFLRFAEDVLFEISQSHTSPADSVYRTGIRWKKFWSADPETSVTKEWINGLFGELTFLTYLVNQYGLSVIDSWSGPLGKDHDFQTSTNLAVEVKTSASVPFQITCNIRQLDPDLFKKLYIVCYHLSLSEDGATLPELVNNLVSIIKDDELWLDKFYAKLAQTGYKLQLESTYNEFRLMCSDPAIFRVDDNFPKITEKSFITPPDHRITGIRYTLELTGIKELTIDSVTRELENFKNNDNK